MSCEENKTKSTGLACAYEAEEKTRVTFRADSSSDLNDKAFVVDTGLDIYLVALDVGSAGTLVAGVGQTLVKISVAEDASASAIATAVGTALNLKSDVKAIVDGSLVTVVNANPGYVSPVAYHSGSDDGDFVIKQCQKGGLDELGFTEGDTEFSGFEPDTQEVLAHQLGSTPLATLNKGVKPEVSLVLLETDTAKLKLLFESIGGDVTYDGVKGFGVGTGKVGGLLNTFSRRLKFYNYNDKTNKAEWITFWKAVIVPDTITFSTENPDKFSVKFIFYPDLDLPEAFKNANIVYFGDTSKVVPVPTL